MAAINESYRDAGLVTLAVDIGEDPETVRGYMERTNLPFVVVLDQDTEVAAGYRISGIPTHYFVDDEGILRDRRIGPMSKEEMERRVQELILGAAGPSD